MRDEGNMPSTATFLSSSLKNGPNACLPHESNSALVDAPGTAAAFHLALRVKHRQGAEPGKETGKEMGVPKCWLIPTLLPRLQTSLLVVGA